MFQFFSKTGNINNFFLSLFLLLISNIEALAYKNKINFYPGYSFIFFDDSGARTQSGLMGYMFMGKFEYDIENKTNLYFELSFLKPHLFKNTTTLDNDTFHCTSGLGIKYYPSTWGKTDFRQHGDTFILITSDYTFNPFVSLGLLGYSLLENSRKKLEKGIVLTGNRFLYGGSLTTGLDVVLQRNWGITFESRYFTLKSLYSKTVEKYPANLLLIGVSFNLGIYYNF